MSSAFELFLFTTDPGLAARAVMAGVNGIVIDWEQVGKEERQEAADAEINLDTVEDLRRVRAATPGRILCRINPIGDGTADEIEAAVSAGADEILVPMVLLRAMTPWRRWSAPAGEPGSGSSSRPSRHSTVRMPGAHQGLWTSTPDNRIREVWTSASNHHLEFRDPSDRVRAERVDSEIDRLLAGLPDRAGNAMLAHRLNQAAYRFPPPALWLAAGLVALALRRPRNVRIALMVSGAAFLVLLVTALGLPAAAEYAMPVVPALALLAGVGLLGPRGRQ